MEPIKLSPDDSIGINDDIIELDKGISICASPSCDEISIKTNPQHKTINYKERLRRKSVPVPTPRLARFTPTGSRADATINGNLQNRIPQRLTLAGATGNLDPEDPKRGFSQDTVRMCVGRGVC